MSEMPSIAINDVLKVGGPVARRIRSRSALTMPNVRLPERAKHAPEMASTTLEMAADPIPSPIRHAPSLAKERVTSG